MWLHSQGALPAFDPVQLVDYAKEFEELRQMLADDPVLSADAGAKFALEMARDAVRVVASGQPNGGDWAVVVAAAAAHAALCGPAGSPAKHRSAMRYAVRLIMQPAPVGASSALYVIAIRLLGISAALDAHSLQVLINAGNRIMGAMGWSVPVVHAYCQVLSKAALGGLSSDVRRLPLASNLPGSLVSLGYVFEGPEKDEDMAATTVGAIDDYVWHVRWAASQALMTIRDCGGLDPAYSWLVASSSRAVAGLLEVADDAMLPLFENPDTRSELAKESARRMQDPNSLELLFYADWAAGRPDSRLDWQRPPPKSLPMPRRRGKVDTRDKLGSPSKKAAPCLEQVDLVNRAISDFKRILIEQVIRKRDDDEARMSAEAAVALVEKLRIGDAALPEPEPEPELQPTPELEPAREPDKVWVGAPLPTAALPSTAVPAEFPVLLPGCS